MNRAHPRIVEDTNPWHDNDLGAMRCFTRRSAALRAEPVALSQAKPAAAIASGVRPIPVQHLQAIFDSNHAARKFAEQHQVDPDEAYRDAVYAEIKDGLIWLGWGAVAALLVVVGLYYGGVL